MRKSMPAEVLTEHRVDASRDHRRRRRGHRHLVPAGPRHRARLQLHAHGRGVLPRPLPQDADGWKICATGYDRTYEATMSTEGVELQGQHRVRRIDHLTYWATAISAPGCSQRMISTKVSSSRATQPAVGSAVGGVDEERAAVARDACLVDTHHHRVRVLRDVEVLGAAGSGWCRTGTRPSCRPAWCCRSGSSCRRPTSGRGRPGRTAVRRRGWAAVPKAKSRVKMPIGVFISPSWVCGDHAVGTDVDRYCGGDRLPAVGACAARRRSWRSSHRCRRRTGPGWRRRRWPGTTGPRHGWGAPN